MSTPWSTVSVDFLTHGEWAIGQGPDAPDRRLFRHILQDLLLTKDDLSVVEVGCGAGIEVEGLKADGLLDRIDYVGLDFTPELIDACRYRNPDVRFALSDVTKPLLVHGDVVYARHVLEHVEDGFGALRNLIAATRELTVISWFIRPTWRPDEVGSGVSDGFLHQTYSAPEMIREAADGRVLARFDFDHHLTRCSVWLISDHPGGLIGPLTSATDFVSCDAFLDAVIPAPEEPWRTQLRETLHHASELAERR